MLSILIEQQVDAVEQDLIEHPPNMVGCSPVCVSAVCGEFDGHADEAFCLLDISLKVLQLTSHRGELLLEGLMFGAEHLERDRIVVVRLKKFALFPLDVEPFRREHVALLISILGQLAQLLLQERVHHFGLPRVKCEPVVEFLDQVFDPGERD